MVTGLDRIRATRALGTPKFRILTHSVVGGKDIVYKLDSMGAWDPLTRDGGTMSVPVHCLERFLGPSISRAEVGFQSRGRGGVTDASLVFVCDCSAVQLKLSSCLLENGVHAGEAVRGLSGIESPGHPRPR